MRYYLLVCTPSGWHEADTCSASGLDVAYNTLTTRNYHTCRSSRFIVVNEYDLDEALLTDCNRYPRLRSICESG